jgi:hypothetical protein
MTARDNRSGVALGVVIVALGLIGALAAGSFLAAMGDARAGRDALTTQPALIAAERALTETQRGWSRERTVVMRDGESVSDSMTFPDGGRASIQVTRLDPYTFWAVADGYSVARSPVGGATRSLNLVWRVAVPTMPITGALTSRGAVDIRDSSVASGADLSPTHLVSRGSCPGPTAGAAGVVAADTSVVCAGGCGWAVPPRLIGTPPKQESVFAGDTNSYARWGAESWVSLAGRADIVLGSGSVVTRPAVSAGRCDVRDPLNWGDPLHAGPCADYFPVIYSPGDLVLRAGSVGQGVLLVDGDLDLEGAEFHGVIVVRDDLASPRGPNHIVGAVMVADARATDPTILAKGTAIEYSSCLIDRALRGSARLVRAKQRGWAELR